MQLIQTAGARAAALNPDGVVLAASFIENNGILLQQIKHKDIGSKVTSDISRDAALLAFFEIFAAILSATFAAHDRRSVEWKEIVTGAAGYDVGGNYPANVPSYYPSSVETHYKKASEEHLHRMLNTDALCAALLMRIFFLDLIPAIELAARLKAEADKLNPANTTVTSS